MTSEFPKLWTDWIVLAAAVISGTTLFIRNALEIRRLLRDNETFKAAQKKPGARPGLPTREEFSKYASQVKAVIISNVLVGLLLAVAAVAYFASPARSPSMVDPPHPKQSSGAEDLSTTNNVARAWLGEGESVGQMLQVSPDDTFIFDRAARDGKEIYRGRWLTDGKRVFLIIKGYDDQLPRSALGVLSGCELNLLKQGASLLGTCYRINKGVEVDPRPVTLSRR